MLFHKSAVTFGKPDGIACLYLFEAGSLLVVEAVEALVAGIGLMLSIKERLPFAVQGRDLFLQVNDPLL